MGRLCETLSVTSVYISTNSSTYRLFFCPCCNVFSFDLVSTRARFPSQAQIWPTIQTHQVVTTFKAHPEHHFLAPSSRRKDVVNRRFEFASDVHIRSRPVNLHQKATVYESSRSLYLPMQRSVYGSGMYTSADITMQSFK